MPDTMMDIIYLHALKVDCIIGVWAWEQQLSQRLTMDLELGCDLRAAAKSDAVEDTVSYKEVAKRVTTFVRASQYALVETLADGIAQLLLAEFAVTWCRVKINKFGAVGTAGDVGVIIERGARA